jgi:pimeloyl-ACP methyl ester carboxylesterase
MTDATITRETRPVSIPAEGVTLQGDLTVPAGARGIIIFAHGSGSSRLSPRNRMVARHLQEAGFGTLLFDLLTGREESVDNVTRALRFDINFLADRLAAATEWLGSVAIAHDLPFGYFGASTGAAAALVTAARHPGVISAVVSRGGRPDLAGTFLRSVAAPTLLIVGSADVTVLELNRKALAQLACENRELAVVPGATHLFEEPGTLERVSELASQWFARFLRAVVHPG